MRNQWIDHRAWWFWGLACGLAAMPMAGVAQSSEQGARVVAAVSPTKAVATPSHAVFEGALKGAIVSHPQVRSAVAQGEGAKLVRSQWQALKQQPHFVSSLFQWLSTNALKLLGYKLGLAYKWLPRALVKKFAMNKVFWQQHT